MDRHAQKPTRGTRKRPALGDPERTITLIDRVRAIANDPVTLAVALTIPEPDHSCGGRPSEFPTYVWGIVNTVVGAFGSARHAVSALRDPLYWALIVEGIRDQLGDAVADSLPDRGPSRSQWNHHKKHLAKHNDPLTEAYRTLTAIAATSAGLFPVDATSLMHPERRSFVYGDGTVLKSPVKPGPKDDEGTDPKTPAQPAPQSDTEATPPSPKPRRVDPASAVHYENGEERAQRAYGTKYIFLAARADETPNTRFILDFERQGTKRGYGGEAAQAVRMLAALHERLPNIRGVCWDGAFRGQHRDALMQRGLTVVTHQHKGNKPQLLLVKQCGCGQRHELWTQKGGICQMTRDVTGEAILTPLALIKLESRPGKQTHRWYQILRLPCGNTHRERINSNADDTKAGFNRAEHLQQIPPHLDEHKRAYGWRADAESLNNNTDRRMWGGRIVAYGAESQTLFLLGYALAQNALARAITESRANTESAA